jgi:hypothetical protein
MNINEQPNEKFTSAKSHEIPDGTKKVGAFGTGGMACWAISFVFLRWIQNATRYLKPDPI